MVEIAPETSEYEIYKESEVFIPDSNGILNCDSLYPNVTFLTNVDNVTINCEYSADTKKYIDTELQKLKAELLSK